MARIAATGAENQHHSKPSQFMADDLLTTEKGEVGGSSPPRPTIKLPMFQANHISIYAAIRIFYVFKNPFKKRICQKFAKNPGRVYEGKFLSARPFRALFQTLTLPGWPNPHALRETHLCSPQIPSKLEDSGNTIPSLEIDVEPIPPR